ncbi:isoamyl acetate-hydrolyzing esterase 1 homolog [Salarias fasciatus]|uniref:Isoamyl acetate-hydrolyzing esterase 1 homolog n=1 Tax=Salarias fasciatus TaxID=181472 RepID=A0A672IAU6_SALFA|nr:isoamyl acetate-hydrolyzing esterase 1 homolog [Salarias fasciatus]
MSKLTPVVWPKVILFGDSITQYSFQPHGWGAEIANKLARKCDVVNRGLSGYNSRWGRMVLPRLLSQSSAERVAAVTLFFGANDSSLEDKNPQQHVPLQEYCENLKDMGRFLSSAGVPSDRLIFITPPPVDEPAWEKECLLKGCPLNRRHAAAGQYAEACVRAAGQVGADVLDLWTLMQQDGRDFRPFLSDGLHLSQDGNQFLAQQLWRLLEGRVADLPFILPYWGDVDHASPESSLLCDL